MDLDELERLLREATAGPWTLAPLEGKYYGTLINLPSDGLIKIWGNRKWVPSARELEQWQPDGDRSEIMCDGHYEDAEDYANAALIAALRNHAEELIRDARRYRSVRRGQHWSVINGIGDTLRAETLDAAVDAIAQEKP